MPTCLSRPFSSSIAAKNNAPTGQTNSDVVRLATRLLKPQTGLDLYRSRRIDCVVLEISLPDQMGFKALVELVPLASRPQVAVVVLTLLTHPGVWRLAKETGAHACLAKEFTTGEDLDRAIQRAVAFVGQLPKEERNRPI
jgi:DNA-binding NarL/FixJ family response regulator